MMSPALLFHAHPCQLSPFRHRQLLSDASRLHCRCHAISATAAIAIIASIRHAMPLMPLDFHFRLFQLLTLAFVLTLLISLADTLTLSPLLPCRFSFAAIFRQLIFSLMPPLFSAIISQISLSFRRRSFFHYCCHYAFLSLLLIFSFSISYCCADAIIHAAGFAATFSTLAAAHARAHTRRARY